MKISNEDFCLSNEDIDNMIKEFEPRANIKKESSIESHSSFDEIFGNQGHVIIHCGPNMGGHWVTLLRDQDKNVLWFDSLGEHPDKYNKNIMKFLKNNGAKNIEINKKVWQGSKTQTCGRWALLICAMNKLPINIKQMYQYLEKMKKGYKTYDEAVLNLVN